MAAATVEAPPANIN